MAWVARRTEADADTLWVIEGAASYGAILAGTVAAHGYPVAAAPSIDAKKRRGVGKQTRSMPTRSPLPHWDYRSSSCVVRA